jgi:hypothetical protein
MFSNYTTPELTFAAALHKDAATTAASHTPSIAATPNPKWKG